MVKAKFLGRHLMVKGQYVKDILEGRKTATIRRGIVKPKYREVIIHGGGKPVAKVLIERVYHKRVLELTDDDARKDGFNSKEELVRELKKVYPGIEDNEWMTIIEFKLLQKLDSLDTSEPYMGLNPVDVARIALRYLGDELDDNARMILLDLTKTASIRATATRIFGSVNKRYIIRNVLRRALKLLLDKGILKGKRRA
ncbi:MAG: ASCH domain-containing protein [Thermoprotei archaeon]|nr:MAG: ASCH domain-containing protein [Thermoprotei archaeon]